MGVKRTTGSYFSSNVPRPAAAASSNQRGKQRARPKSLDIPNPSAGRATYLALLLDGGWRRRRVWHAALLSFDAMRFKVPGGVVLGGRLWACGLEFAGENADHSSA